jgi:hypothetical protein
MIKRLINVFRTARDWLTAAAALITLNQLVRNSSEPINSYWLWFAIAAFFILLLAYLSLLLELKKARKEQEVIVDKFADTVIKFIQASKPLMVDREVNPVLFGAAVEGLRGLPGVDDKALDDLLDRVSKCR